MESLRSAVIKLAHAKPELRAELLPLLSKEAAPDYKKYVERKRREGKKPLDQLNWELRVEHDMGRDLVEHEGGGYAREKTPAEESQEKAEGRKKLKDQRREQLERTKKKKEEKNKPKEAPKEEPKEEKKPSLLDRAKSFFTGKGKKAFDQDIRANLIRLAHANPELREELLPLLTKQAMEFPSEGALKKYLESHPGADRRNHSVAKPSAGEGSAEAPKADKNKGKGLRERKVPTPKFKGSEEQVKQAKAIVEKYGMTDEELDDFADWRRAKPKPGDRTLDFATLKREWVESIKDPKKKEAARKRLAKMSPAEFKILYLAVVADDEGEMAKMAKYTKLARALLKALED